MSAMERGFICVAFAIWLALPGQVAAETGTMSVAVFLAKAEALRAQGPMALFSSDVGLLKSEVAGSAQAFRKQIKAEAASGKPSACPPEHGALTSDDIIAHMRDYPVAARPRISVSQAVADLFRKRYPCPAR